MRVATEQVLGLDPVATYSDSRERRLEAPCEMKLFPQVDRAASIRNPLDSLHSGQSTNCRCDIALTLNSSPILLLNDEVRTQHIIAVRLEGSVCILRFVKRHEVLPQAIRQPSLPALLARAVDVGTVVDPEHADRTGLTVDLVDDAVRPSAGRPETGQFATQGMPDHVRPLDERPEHELDNGGGDLDG
jgi:hypothetical protein